MTKIYLRITASARYLPATLSKSVAALWITPNRSSTTMHNKRILHSSYSSYTKGNKDNTTYKTCNCRQKNNCPLNGNCLQSSVVYQATVTRNDNNTSEKYIVFNWENIILNIISLACWFNQPLQIIYCIIHCLIHTFY